MITTPVRDDIRAFAADVRSHLDDLPSDDVDDLLDGLEADLSDQADEAGEGFALPDAATYAAELRAAAGLPERDASGAAEKREPILAQVMGGWRAFGDAVRANPAGAWLLDLLASLRPVWWVLRAVVLYMLVGPSFVPGYGAVPGMLASILTAFRFPGILIMVVFLVISVQWGRGRWMPKRPVRVVRTVVNVVAVILAPYFLIGLVSSASSALWDSSWQETASVTPGLAVDGERIRNIYAYDAQGNPLPSVQLFTQDGAPLTTVGTAGSDPWDAYFAGGGGPVPVPYTVPGSTPEWNVFPLREIPAGQQSWDMDADLAAARVPTFPFSRVQPLADATQPNPSATPGAEASPAPSATTTSGDPQPTP